MVNVNQSVYQARVSAFLDDPVRPDAHISRLITIYDCKISVEWSGTASDGNVVTGKVTIPEVSHEITVDRLSDYTASQLHASPAVSFVLTRSFAM